MNQDWKQAAKPQEQGQTLACRGDTGKTQNSDSKRVTETESPVVRTRADERNLDQKGEERPSKKVKRCPIKKKKVSIVKKIRKL